MSASLRTPFFTTAAVLALLLGVAELQAVSLNSLLHRASPAPAEADAALRDKEYDHAAKLYDRLLEDGAYDSSARGELFFGRGLAEHHLQDFDASVRSFSESLLSQDADLRLRAHRGISLSLFEQGARGLSRQPQITMKRWQDALSHIDAALKLDPDNAELKANRQHVTKLIQELRRTLELMEQQQNGKKGDKGKQGQKGAKGQKGQKGQSGEEGEGAEGEEGDDEGNGAGEPQEAEKTGEKKDGDDGIGGKDAKNLPQGNLQVAKEDPKGKKGDKEAFKEGEGKDGKKGDKTIVKEDGDKKGEKDGKGGISKKEVAASGSGDARRKDQRNQVNEKTGYSIGQAESLIEHYMDKREVNRYSNQYRRPAPNNKDW
ncbi:MAG: hypothetical protein IPK32_18850 [Verrucomicrobiaceae bacterium]|nr:hypothetical protein [Verrucomicrobiaceae bacterium]